MAVKWSNLIPALVNILEVSQTFSFLKKYLATIHLWNTKDNSCDMEQLDSQNVLIPTLSSVLKTLKTFYFLKKVLSSYTYMELEEQ